MVHPVSLINNSLGDKCRLSGGDHVTCSNVGTTGFYQPEQRNILFYKKGHRVCFCEHHKCNVSHDHSLPNSACSQSTALKFKLSILRSAHPLVQASRISIKEVHQGHESRQAQTKVFGKWMLMTRIKVALMAHDSLSFTTHKNMHELHRVRKGMTRSALATIRQPVPLHVGKHSRSTLYISNNITLSSLQHPCSQKENEWTLTVWKAAVEDLKYCVLVTIACSLNWLLLLLFTTLGSARLNKAPIMAGAVGILHHVMCYLNFHA